MSAAGTAPAAGDPAGLRETLRAFPTGVVVVTVGGPEPHGMTANSFTSVSLDPALVLVCVARSAVLLRRLRRSGLFGVSVLSGWQEGVARHFADDSRPLGPRGFEACDWLPGEHTGSPLIGAAAAWLECRIWRSHPAGDHEVVIGEVLDAQAAAAPLGGLLYWQRQFGAVLPTGRDG